MAQFFSDLFEGTDGDELPVYNPNWVRQLSTGRAIITAGRARHNSTSTAAYYSRSDVSPPSADYTVRGKFYTPSVPASGHSFGITARGVGSTQSFYWIRLLGGTGLVLARMVNGTSSTLGTYPYTFVAGSEITVDLKVNGDQVSAYLDGALILGPFTDTTYTAAGVVGLRSINGSTSIQLSEMSAETNGSTIQSFSYSGVGGLNFSGVASPVRSRISLVTGGIQLGGIASIITGAGNKSVTVIPGGGILLNGSAPLTKGGSIPTNASITFGGQSIIQRVSGGLEELVGSIRDVLVEKLKIKQLWGSFNENTYWRGLAGGSDLPLNDVKKKVLIDLGKTGAINDMEKDYWENL